MIDSDYYVDNTDEVFAVVTTGSIGHGFKTLFKHFISGFLTFAALVTIFCLTIITCNLISYDEDGVALDYFKNTKDSGVNISYYGDTDSFFYEKETYLDEKLENHSSFVLYRNKDNLWQKSNLFDYDAANNKMCSYLNFNLMADVDDIDFSVSQFEMLGGRFPEDTGEVTLTKVIFDLYKNFGYSDDGHYVAIKTIDDIIGRRVCGFKVVGVIDTKCSMEMKDSLDDMTEEEKQSYKYAIYDDVISNVHVALFVHHRYMNNKNYYCTPSCLYVEINHSEDDLVFCRIYEDYFAEKTHFYTRNHNYDVWAPIFTYDAKILFEYIFLGSIGLGIIMSLVLSVGSFRDKKKTIKNLYKREYDAKDYVGLFTPEILILVLSAFLFTCLIWIAAPIFFNAYAVFDPVYLYKSGAALGLAVVLGEVCVVLALAFGFVRIKVGKKFKIKDKIEDKVVDRYY